MKNKILYEQLINEIGVKLYNILNEDQDSLKYISIYQVVAKDIPLLRKLYSNAIKGKSIEAQKYIHRMFFEGRIPFYRRFYKIYEYVEENHIYETPEQERYINNVKRLMDLQKTTTRVHVDKNLEFANFFGTDIYPIATMTEEDFENIEGKQNQKSKLPDEFTGDPLADPLLYTACFRPAGKENTFIDKNDFTDDEFSAFSTTHKPVDKDGNDLSFNALAKVVEPGIYQDKWNLLVDWIKRNPKFADITVKEKDSVLLQTFRKNLRNMPNLICLEKVYDTTFDDMKIQQRNQCQEKFQSLTKMAWKIYPDKNQTLDRANWRKAQYDKYIESLGIYKYAKWWGKEFSVTYKV